MNKKFEILYALSREPDLTFSNLYIAVSEITGQSKSALSASLGMYKSTDLVDQESYGNWYLTDAGEAWVKSCPEYDKREGGQNSTVFAMEEDPEDTLKDTPREQDTDVRPARPPHREQDGDCNMCGVSEGSLHTYSCPISVADRANATGPDSVVMHDKPKPEKGDALPPVGPVTDQATIDRLLDPDSPAAGIVIPVPEPGPVEWTPPDSLDMEIAVMAKLVEAMALGDQLDQETLSRISRWFLERYGDE